MRLLAKTVGLSWMAICAVLWLWVGYTGPSCDYGIAFTLPRLLCESRYGLTFLPILLGGLGYAAWLWGRASKPEKPK